MTSKDKQKVGQIMGIIWGLNYKFQQIEFAVNDFGVELDEFNKFKTELDEILKNNLEVEE